MRWSRERVRAFEPQWRGHAEVGIRRPRFAVDAVNKGAVPSLTRGHQFVSHDLAAAQQI